MCNSLVNTHAIVYVDDIIVGGSTQEEHDSNLEKVLLRLAEMEMHINTEKV